MTSADFEALVHKLEGETRRNPSGYQVKVLLIAWLGNVYLGLMLLLIVPGETWILNVEGENSGFRRKFKRIKSAQIV